jgi:hypothetical protein
MIMLLQITKFQWGQLKMLLLDIVEVIIGIQIEFDWQNLET